MEIKKINYKKMNKKGLEFKLAFFALIIVSMTIIAVGTWITEWSNEYDSNLSYDLNEYDTTSAVQNETKDQQGKVSITSTGTGEEFEGTSIRGVFGILNNIYAPFRMVFGDNGMIDSLTERFGLPDYIRQGLVSMMIIAITFALVAIFFRLPRRSA